MGLQAWKMFSTLNWSAQSCAALFNGFLTGQPQNIFMKRQVRIDFCDIGCNQSKTDYFLHWVLAERFELQLCDQPDFIVHNLFGHEHRLHSGIRILFTGESDLPDYSISDYSIGPRIVDDPRHLHLPAYVIRGPAEKIIKRQDDHEKILASKNKFCSFVVSQHNPRKNSNRLDFFEKLSRYKPVDSGGKTAEQHRRATPRSWSDRQGRIFAFLQIQHLF